MAVIHSLRRLCHAVLLSQCIFATSCRDYQVTVKASPYKFYAELPPHDSCNHLPTSDPETPDGSPAPPKIIATNDLTPAEQSSNQEPMRSVVLIESWDTGQPCTGWLASNELVVTALHCMGHSEWATITFDHLESHAGQRTNSHGCVLVGEFDTPRTPHDLGPDIAIFRCWATAQEPGSPEWPPPLSIASDDAPLGAQVAVIQQGCKAGTGTCPQYKIYSEGQIVPCSSAPNDGIDTEYDFCYDADTYEGASGGPVIALNTNQVVGVHHGASISTTGLYNHGGRPSYIRCALQVAGTVRLLVARETQQQ